MCPAREGGTQTAAIDKGVEPLTLICEAQLLVLICFNQMLSNILSLQTRYGERGVLSGGLLHFQFRQDQAITPGIKG